jgi:hypothetical protein
MYKDLRRLLRGNKIIVQKKKVKVPKRDANQQSKKEDATSITNSI